MDGRVNQMERGQSAGKEKTEPFPFICFGEPEGQSENLGVETTVPQVPAVEYDKNYASTHSHRLQFMMHALNN
jgi:hypothetical protein